MGQGGKLKNRELWVKNKISADIAAGRTVQLPRKKAQGETCIFDV